MIMKDALLDKQKPGSEPQLYRFLEPGEKVPEGAECFDRPLRSWIRSGMVGLTLKDDVAPVYRVPVPTPTANARLVVAELERTLAAERRAMDMLCQLNPDLYRDLECLRRLAKEAAE